MTGPRATHNIALIGFMGTGKSSVGRHLATHLHFRFVDTDELIEARAGRSVADIFVQAGEEVFRGIERQVVSELAKSRKTIISTGGGVGANPEKLASLQTHALGGLLLGSSGGFLGRVDKQTHR